MCDILCFSKIEEYSLVANSLDFGAPLLFGEKFCVHILQMMLSDSCLEWLFSGIGNRGAEK